MTNDVLKIRMEAIAEMAKDLSLSKEMLINFASIDFAKEAMIVARSGVGVHDLAVRAGTSFGEVVSENNYTEKDVDNYLTLLKHAIVMQIKFKVVDGKLKMSEIKEEDFN